MSHAIDKELKDYIDLLNPGQKRSILAVIKTFLPQIKKGDERISREQYNKEITEANTRIENGEYFSQDEAEKQAATW